MLQLLLGGSGSGKTTLLYQRIRARAEKGEKSILLVPEQFTSSTEGRIYRELGDALSGKYVDTWLPGSDVQIDGYDMKTIAYHCALLHDAGLIYDYKAQYAGDGLCFFGVGRLTWEGHELLDKIKSDTVWNKTKETIKSKGIPLVLDAVKEISSAIVTSMVKAAIQGI